MYNVVQESKYQNETISMVLDFADELKSGEIVSSCTFIITLITGTDPSPSGILYQTFIPSGTKVDQKFRLGIPGVIYEITWQVTGSLGTLVEKTTPLAILPETSSALPQFTFIYLTSFLYPYTLQDGVQGFLAPNSGRLFKYLAEQVTGSIQPALCSIYGANHLYSIKIEQVTGTLQPSIGSIFGSTTSYTNPPDGVNTAFAPIIGSIYGSSLSYNYPSEGIIPTFLPSSGTIV